MTETCNFNNGALLKLQIRMFMSLGTAVKLHFPVVHVSFVLSAEIRRHWFICSRKEELLRKRTFPCTLCQTNVQKSPESCCWRCGWNHGERLLPHKCVFPVYFPDFSSHGQGNSEGKLRVHRGLRVGVEEKWFPHCELRYPGPEKTRAWIQNGSVMMFYVGGQPVWGG